MSMRVANATDTFLRLGFLEFTEEFEACWNGLAEDEQESVAFSVDLLEEHLDCRVHVR